MSAVLEQLRGIIGSGFPGLAEHILARHAHELAEQIRNSGRLRDITDDHMSDCNAAADEIDPEATS
ncbi:hypothetical protein [Streptomyces fulvorobeus]|uniref:Uncharacterized protein n=1 Tax=Streptomyces fulvorobeus TaxID=284028 RepID=A0A7J0CE43_9ACTN|nr:hypothetical protein [Streptomyces fulvorobeus]NYE44221.1 hypothetical protein [Streptomyces fulvorobeus]GFN00736.1 hypothetical protein Sfulv_55460 [Streptomyces fulvorobeus]